ncbi:TetR family transcriptional regulator [Saccharomonospora viridis]|jgi:TetR/AcrR family tetracycline transcriptional repressor|uniref:Transcriptional regulator n=2 Tax=Saccharomonospora viridis TaxID=1852 RepID=C7MYE9_SACVD|nr:TetR family transcriptional regulator [Saccharomonospora viridis]ACU97368.1 transcriptional regulator [Saccharomonospora viridis DSM 43017]KHF43802.1 TetR family transcriptional regulator [Saccharomonospora viridis]SFP83638.1 transcriptional regulator, TetR family [Saccharomonospora viridis]
MPRPKQPLLTRESIVATALEIIDTDGLDALSTPRLAKEMNVTAPSLYHHFQDKNEILAEVARAILLEIPFPRRKPDSEWSELFVQLSLNFRRAVLRHRNAAPILLQHMPRDVLISVYERIAVFLREAGVPPRLHVLMLDGLEKYTLGTSLTEAMHSPRRRTSIFGTIDPEEQPTLAEAVKANEWNAEQLFVRTIRSFLAGVASGTENESE